MATKKMIGPVFAMDGFTRPLVLLANSATRALTPPVRSVNPPPSPTSSKCIKGAITLGQLAQPKQGGIK